MTLQLLYYNGVLWICSIYPQLRFHKIRILLSVFVFTFIFLQFTLNSTVTFEVKEYSKFHFFILNSLCLDLVEITEYNMSAL